MIYDAFMLHDEMDMLEARLTELEDVPGLVHVIVEARVTHQDKPKPLYFYEHKARFDRWQHRIVYVVASDLPTVEDAPNQWARENAQREWIGTALRGADPEDIVLQSDVDEIPRALVVRNVKPRSPVALDMAFHPFAVDWVHPERWRGTVACRVRHLSGLGAFSRMRNMRNTAQPIPDAGWHFSWVGGTEYALHKLASFCHPEIADRTLDGLRDDVFLTEGFHVDGHKLAAYDGDDWPRWVRDRKCPTNWFRPR